MIISDHEDGGRIVFYVPTWTGSWLIVVVAMPVLVFITRTQDASGFEDVRNQISNMNSFVQERDWN
jgi:hypothetical protein